MESGLSAFKKTIAVYEERDQERILEALRGGSKALSAEISGSSGWKNTGQEASCLSRALEIASILISLNLDADTLIAALILNRGTEPGASAFTFNSCNSIFRYRHCYLYLLLFDFICYY